MPVALFLAKQFPSYCPDSFIWSTVGEIRVKDRATEADTFQTQTILRSEELAAQRTAVIGRTVALVAIVPVVTVLAPWPGPVFTYALLMAFVLLGWGAWFLAKSPRGRPWHQYVFVFADFALLTFTLLYPNPLIPFDYPPQFALRFGAFVYFFVLIAGLAYVYQPKLVLWGGVSAALCWTIGAGWLIALPDSVWSLANDINVELALELAAQPTFIDIGVRLQEIAVLLIASGLVALAVGRSRKIAVRQARLARERENLGRYFPRKTARLLAERSNPFPKPSEHEAAVLFADLVDFTAWSEKHTPGETIDLLREVHGLLADIVFRHNGTLDKFIGDGLMATFGTPEPSATDASNAVAAMVEMSDAFERWASEGQLKQNENLRLAIGVHYGPVVIGNIGSKNRLEFAVLGDTVNVASRLESATRKIDCRCLASADLVSAAEAVRQTSNETYLTRLTSRGPIKLRGRSEAIDVYSI